MQGAKDLNWGHIPLAGQGHTLGSQGLKGITTFPLILSQRYPFRICKIFFFPLVMTNPPRDPKSAETAFSLGKSFFNEQNTAPASDAGQEEKKALHSFLHV